VSLTPEAVKQAWELLRAGRSRVSIARELGCSPATVTAIKDGTLWSSITRTLEPLPTVSYRLTADQIRAAWQMLLDGRSQAETARTLGIPYSTLGGIVHGKAHREITATLPPLPLAVRGRPGRSPGGPVTANRSFLPTRTRGRVREAYRQPQPPLVEDRAGRIFLEAEVALIRRVLIKHQGG
jgi:DNA-binding CsgD family transcriptional regulator